MLSLLARPTTWKVVGTLVLFSVIWWGATRADRAERAATQAAVQAALDSATTAGYQRGVDAVRSRMSRADTVYLAGQTRWRTVVESLPPTTVRETTYVAACSAALSACDSARAAARILVAAQDSLIAAQARQLTGLGSRLVAAERRARPRIELRPYVGYGVTVAPGGSITHGFQGGIGGTAPIRLF